jgi:Gly-Xaa carboxypeptidase
VDQTTLDQWKYPPYSGHYDGERIWGRGSNDDKSGLIGVL